MQNFSGFNIIEEMDGERLCPAIVISEFEEQRLRKPWRKTLIIKLLGRKIGFKALESKISQLWAQAGVLDIVDLTDENFMVKFSAYSDYELALTKGPRTIYGHYLTVHKWEPNFDPEAEIDQVAVWVHLPGLPLRLYDEKFLTFLGNRIGTTLKVDNTTIEQARGKYARVCVKIDLNKELLSEYPIKGKTYCIKYESMHTICFQCEKYGHFEEGCPMNYIRKAAQMEEEERGEELWEKGVMKEMRI